MVEGNYKYTYNNGHLAMADPLASAACNFLNAMERIPSITDQYKAKNEVLEMEIPQLQEIAVRVEEGGRAEAVEVRTCRP